MKEWLKPVKPKEFKHLIPSSWSVLQQSGSSDTGKFGGNSPATQRRTFFIIFLMFVSLQLGG
jgi:hypothetical protein